MFKKTITNWAKTVKTNTRCYYTPKTEEELVSIIQQCIKTNTPIKVCGKRHSYNGIFLNQPEGVLLSLKKLNKILNIDTNKQLVTFQAGASTPKLLYKLKKYNLTIPNLGTNIMDNFIGACSNGYHGSGMTYQIQSSLIQSITIITGQGKKLVINRTDKLFDAFGVNIGALGIIIEVTIKCEKSFKLNLKTKQMDYLDFKKNFHQLLKNNKHIKFIWAPHTTIFQLWCANETTKKQDSFFKKIKIYFWDGIIINSILHGFLLYIASINKKFIPKINYFITRLLVPQKGEVIYNSYWIYFLPHLIKQDTIEFAIPIKDTFSFFEELQQVIKTKPFFVQTPIEIRFVKNDNFWLSPAYKNDVCYIGTKTHFLPFFRTENYKLYFQAFNNLIEKYHGKPHWGKQLYMSKSYIKTHYEKWDEFWTLSSILDPMNLFSNTFLDQIKTEKEKISLKNLSKEIKIELKKHQLL